MKSGAGLALGVVGLLEIGYLAAAGLVALASFHDAPGRLIEAHREGRVLEDVGYHAANLASVLVVAGWLLAILLGVDRRLPGEVFAGPTGRGVGLVLAGAGFALGVWARVSLGTAFAPTAAVPPDERIVDAGPYEHLRHPFYVGLLLALAGGVLVLSSLATLICLVALLPLVRAIAVLEERHLAEEVGRAYEDYRARVPRWLPRL